MRTRLLALLLLATGSVLMVCVPARSQAIDTARYHATQNNTARSETAQDGTAQDDTAQDDTAQDDTGKGKAATSNTTNSSTSRDKKLPETAAPGSADNNAAVREVTPSGFYLRNKRGDLVYVPDVSYEQFEQLLKQQRKLATPQRPAFSIKVMTITGEVIGDQLEAVVDFTLEGLRLEGSPEGTWFRVPLRFDQAYLYKKPSFEGPGRHFLTFDDQQGGYICWLQMSADAVHTVRLPLLVPVNRVGEESRFTLQAPSPLASTLTVTVPENPAEGTVKELVGDVGRPLSFTSNGKTQGVFSIRGIRGNVSISWHKSRAAERQANVRLDVFGTIVVTADELLQEVRSDGRFVVRGFGGPVEVFQVRLPPGMRLREVPEDGYEVRPLVEEESVRGDGQLVEVRLDRPTTNEVHIRLIAELPSSQDATDWPLTVSKLVDSSLEFMPARFEFEGVARHRGQIDLVVKGDWSLLWAEDPALPRTKTNGKAASSGLLARFRYHNQTNALRVWIRQQPARITVEPTYDVYVDAQQARLFASLVCRTSGSKAGSLKCSLPGWTAEIVNFADVDSTLPIDMSGSTLVIPIPVEAQAAGHFSLQIEARQSLMASVVSSTSPLKIVLPTIAAENPTRANLIVSPATVTLIPADNILLTPRPKNMQALSPLITPIATSTRQTTDPAAAVPDDGARSYEATVFRYRDRGASEQAVFVADFKVQPQSISVSVASTVTLDRRSYGVKQRLSYRVLHEPVDTLELAVPKSLVDSELGSLRILLDGEPLTPSFAEASVGRRVPVRVRLPQPMLGPIELSVIHPRKPIAKLRDDESLQLTIPLVFTATGSQTHTTVIGNTLTIVHQTPMRVDLAGGAWTVAESESGPGKMVLTTASDGSDAVIDVSLSGRNQASSSILDQVWVQTWLTDTQRRDRTVFRLRTSEPEMRIRLPRIGNQGVTAIEVVVDQRKVEVSPLNDRSEITFAIPNDGTHSMESHVVELWYQSSASDRSIGSLTFRAALLDAVDHVERCYWQLVLPRREIVLWGSQSQAAELTWRGWAGWRRTPLREQRDLERWIGAARRAPIPPELNTYLFTSFGAPQQLSAVTSSRVLVLFTASGLALAIGLLLVYFPAMRHPALLMTVGIFLLVLAPIAPEVSVLFAQAASLGIVLALLARLLRAVLLRAHPATATVQGRTQFSDSKMVEMRYSRTDGSSRITTASAPAAVQTPSAESKS